MQRGIPGIYIILSSNPEICLLLTFILFTIFEFKKKIVYDNLFY